MSDALTDDTFSKFMKRSCGRHLCEIQRHRGHGTTSDDVDVVALLNSEDTTDFAQSARRK
jgi:hypothetical protein